MRACVCVCVCARSRSDGWMKSYTARRVFWPIRGFLELFKPIGDAVSVPKKVNDDVSCNDICKFEFGTTKNHYSDIHNDILHKHQKSSQRGYFLALKSPRDTNQFFLGQQ